MLYAAFAAAVLFIAACVFAASFLVNGRRQTYEESLEWQASKYDTSFYAAAEKTDYTVSGEDGYVLHVRLLRGASADGRYVIISHGYTDNMMGSLKYARFWLDMGYSCILYDLRGHGKNGKTATTYGYKEGKDLALLVGDTRMRYSDIRVLGLHGESLGAATTVMSLKYSPEVDFAVADCGFSDIENVLKNVLRKAKLPSFPVDMQGIGLRIRYGCSFSDMRPIEALEHSTVPILFVHGRDDSFILPQNSRDMYEAAKGPRELCLIDGAEHAVSAVVAPEEYRKTLERFILKLDTEHTAE